MKSALALQRAPTRTGPRLQPRYEGLDDSAVITAYLKGDERAFSVLYERYAVRLLNFAYRSIGDRERAEDIVQEAFLRVYRHASRFDRRKKFSTWVYTIASNLCRNELRNRKRDPVIPFQKLGGGHEEDERPIEFEDTKLAPDRLMHKRYLEKIVRNAIAALPERHRTVFILREIEVRTYIEIAEIAGCNLGTVKSRLNRARTAFAAHIEPYLR